MANITFNFTNENFIVTGGSSGMGRQIALELANAGAKVLIIARRQKALEKVKEMYPDNICICSADVSNVGDVKSGIDEFINQNGKIAGFVHTAGIDGLTPLKMFDQDLAKKIMDISFWSAVNLLQLLQKKKYSCDKASFVLFSSVASKRGEKGMFAYSAAKAAVSTTVKSLAKEISSRGLRINAICPGRVRTPMTEDNLNEEVVSRHLLGEGNPEDISGVVLFLLSDRARWITGTDVIVDGGYLIN